MSRVASELFLFPAATRRDPAVDAWLDSQPDPLGSLARAWFTQLRRCGPDVRELLHDGCAVACVDDAAFAQVNVFRTHMHVGFFMGAYLDDPAGLLEGTGKRMRHVKVRAQAPPDSVALEHLIEDAYADMRRRQKT